MLTKILLKTKTLAIWIGLALPGTTIASITPFVLSFSEGEQFNLTVSGFNFNRIFIEGEKITQLSYPEGAFVIDKSELQDPDIKEGSVYLRPLFETPVTVFLTTDKGHHLSLNLKPDEGLGKTLRFVAKAQTKMNYIKPTIHDETEVDEIMAAMKEGQTPKEFHEKHPVSRPFYVKKDIKVLLVKQYKGERMTGYVYRLENKSNHEIALSAEMFSAHLAQSLSLSDEVLAPQKVAYLYGLYANEG
ncbi:TPA: type-F conjugative transfer system secretin TraK [Legionella pneumophila]|nr:type-F conjugative transfer system secretin TraK [Legionella pneumophila]